MPEDFAAAAADTLGGMADSPRRELLTRLSFVAAECPRTPGEAWYQGILRETFWTLVHTPDELDEDYADSLGLGMLLAMTSLDRGGHVDAAIACEDTLVFMSELSPWSGKLRTDPGT
ncbi:MAG: hypothetical protein HOU81_01180 [Hamadaea sp.]|uniref:hypothetical protein n=1 Tax=Hamadaea sp. TaxID=2024425 RepID=UPI0017CC099D|nr:hypothetical protein [Hamadaea sp.]NUR69410.1 hypothetical protein [Hamadaea sp.]NUT23825.1 hypothetical protein [Hamadaea sp.]